MILGKCRVWKNYDFRKHVDLYEKLRFRENSHFCASHCTQHTLRLHVCLVWRDDRMSVRTHYVFTSVWSRSTNDRIIVSFILTITRYSMHDTRGANGHIAVI